MGEDSQEGGNSRRRFLMSLPPALALGAAGLAVNQSQETGQNSFELVNFSVGSVKIAGLKTEHDRDSLEIHQQEIERYVQQYGLIIPEYFPPEYENLTGVPLVGGTIKSYEKRNALFTWLSQTGLNQSCGRVMVLDPACGSEFIASFVKGAVATGLGGGAVAVKTNDEFSNLEGNTKNNVSRRKFLKVMAQLAVIGTSTVELSNGYMAVENDMRRVMVAEKLTWLGEILEPGIRPLLIYPGTHMNKIIYYSQNHQERQARLEVYHQYLGEPAFNNLMAWRYWERGEQGGWKRVGKSSG